MRNFADSLARTAGYAFAPLLLVQGVRYGRRAPALPEPAGPPEGVASPDGAVQAPPAVQLLVMGEDGAAGVGVADQAEALGYQCATALAHRTGQAVEWQVTARRGAKASQALSELVPLLGGRRFDVAVVVLGVNDVVGLTLSRRWRRQMSDLVRALEDRLQATGGVVVCGLPRLSDFTALPQPLRAVLGGHARALDRVLAQVADASTRCRYRDTPSDLEVSAGTLYGSAEGYRRWAEHLVPAMLSGPPRPG